MKPTALIRLFSPDRATCLAGFSMGANFPIRMAERASDEGFGGLHHVFAVNPPVDPLDSTRRVDEAVLIRGYFLKKWKKSLETKQNLYPGLYDFRPILAMKKCIPMTEAPLESYTSITSLEDYFGRYDLREGHLGGISLPRE